MLFNEFHSRFFTDVSSRVLLVIPSGVPPAVPSRVSSEVLFGVPSDTSIWSPVRKFSRYFFRSTFKPFFRNYRPEPRSGVAQEIFFGIPPGFSSAMLPKLPSKVLYRNSVRSFPRISDQRFCMNCFQNLSVNVFQYASKTFFRSSSKSSFRNTVQCSSRISVWICFSNSIRNSSRNFVRI